MLSVAQLDERIEKCLAILADNPHSQVFAALADAYRKRGEFGRAFAVCKSGLKHHPDYAPAHIVMAKLFVHQGMYDDAMQSLKVAVEQDGVTHASEYLEAEILIGQREFEFAQAMIDRLRVTDRGNPAIKDLAMQLKAAVNSQAAQATMPYQDSGTDVVEPQVAPSEDVTATSTFDWSSWATELAAFPRVIKTFAVELSDSGTTPFSVLSEQGQGQAGVDTVSICTALFASIDAECRANGSGVVHEIRIERADGEIWCRRLAGCVIGLAGLSGISYGAMRQKALDNAARVTNSAKNQ